MASTEAHSHLGPRTWLAGRRLRSMSAASLRMPSMTAVTVSSLRFFACARFDGPTHALADKT